MTKVRLQELENELTQIDIDIQKEKHKDYSLLTLDMIESFLRKQVFEGASDIKIRKLLINTFLRQIILYEDKVIILFNFIPPIDNPKLTLEENLKTEKQITSAFSNPSSSCLLPQSAPKKRTDLIPFLILHIVYPFLTLRHYIFQSFISFFWRIIVFFQKPFDHTSHISVRSFSFLPINRSVFIEHIC